MTQTAIPYIFFRGGTSRGPYFNRSDLPEDRKTLSQVLIAVLGSGQPLNIDGIGGGASVTTKVAMLSRSDDPWADIDYFFAQVSVTDRQVDYRPTCGNILSAVGPAAIEMGLVTARDGATDINILSTNTGARISATISTPGARVTYEGNAAITGVPGTSAPVALKFMDVVGSVTGSFLPTGNIRDEIDGIEVTCMDVAMPMVIARAEDFGLSGEETCQALDADRDLLGRMEKLRLKAGHLMKMGDVAQSVTPKVGLLSRARQGGTLSARYFTPWNCHPSMAVTGAQCLASCALMPGSVADGLLERPAAGPATVTIEHPQGTIDVLIDYEWDQNGFHVKSAGLLRTARKLAAGEVFVPESVWTR